jgi:hypothetical protein
MKGIRLIWKFQAKALYKNDRIKEKQKMINTSLKTACEIEQKAVNITREFLQYVGPPNNYPVEWPLIKKTSCHILGKCSDSSKSIKVFMETGGTLHISIYPDNILGIPAGALQGWLELEITQALFMADSDQYTFNFKNQIQPLMPVAGSSLYFIRELAEGLSRSLKKLDATKFIMRIDRGLPQVYYSFYLIAPAGEERELYENLLPHNWTRASHLCRKLADYIALSCLAEKGVGFSQLLLSEWPQQLGLIRADRVFMEEAAFVARQYHGDGFSVQLVEMFKMLRDSLLLVRSEDTAPNSPNLSV